MSIRYGEDSNSKRKMEYRMKSDSNPELMQVVSEEIINAVEGLPYFFDTTVKVAKLRGKTIGSVFVICNETTLVNLFLEKYSETIGPVVASTRSNQLIKPGDVTAFITNLQEGDTIFIKLDGWNNRSIGDAKWLFKQAIEKQAIDIVLGKGPAANSIHLDLPSSNYIFNVIETDEYANQLMAQANYIFDFNKIPMELKYKYELLKKAEPEELVIDEETLTKLVELLCAGKGTAKEYIRKLSDYIYLNGLEKRVTIDVVSDVFDISKDCCQPHSASDLNGMDPYDFERFIKDLFTKMGYLCQHIGQSGDQGVDIIAERDDVKIGIQAKLYSGPVGNSAVQEVISGVNYYGLDKGFVVTNSTFTLSAINLANSSRVALWDGNKLERKMLEYMD